MSCVIPKASATRVVLTPKLTISIAVDVQYLSGRHRHWTFDDMRRDNVRFAIQYLQPSTVVNVDDHVIISLNVWIVLSVEELVAALRTPTFLGDAVKPEVRCFLTPCMAALAACDVPCILPIGVTHCYHHCFFCCRWSRSQRLCTIRRTY